MNEADRDWLKWQTEGGAGGFADRAQRVLAELDRRGAAIERVRALHVPTEEITGYQAGQPVRSTVCAVCDETYDDDDPGGNVRRVREPSPWPCETIAALDGEPAYEFVNDPPQYRNPVTRVIRFDDDERP